MTVTLSDRFGIRQLQMSDLDHIRAVLAHSIFFHSPVWAPLYRGRQHTVYLYYILIRPMVIGCIEQGYSYGVFDRQYAYKHAESEKTQGALLWDLTDNNVDGDKLMAEMDFPLVSVALGWDKFIASDFMQNNTDIGKVMLYFGVLKQAMDRVSEPRLDQVVPTAAHQVLLRRGTATRIDYTGQGVARALAHHMMKEVAAHGFSKILISSQNEALTKVWAHPPAPYTAQVCGELDTTTLHSDDPQNPMNRVQQVCTDILLHLQATS